MLLNRSLLAAARAIGGLALTKGQRWLAPVFSNSCGFVPCLFENP
jgi:hypothetical protein